MIYLDNAATSWPKPEEVYTKVSECLRHLGASPGRGSHSMSLSASMILYETREELALAINVPNPNQIAFFLNATDALNTALIGLLKPGDTVVTTSMEHNAVVRPLIYLQRQGVNLNIVSCAHDGQFDLNAMSAALAACPKAVVVTHASNVTGTVMPLAEIGSLARKHNVILIVDAAQTIGIEEINFLEMNIDILAASGHKGLLGPQGTGILAVRDGIELNPLRFGGTGSKSESDEQPDFMPDRFESGTPNTPGIAGLLAGLRFIKNTGRENIRSKEQKLCQKLREGLSEIAKINLYPPAIKNTAAHTAVVSFTLTGIDSSFVSSRLEKNYGIISRAGLHCAPWAHRTIGTLEKGIVRLSPGFFNTSADIEKTLEAIKTITF